MRKVVVFNRVSIDGAFARVDGDINWFIPDPEVDKAAHELMQPDTVLFGRTTYQMFEAVWPRLAENPDAPKGARKLAEELNQMTKVVFSRTLDEVTWQNTRLVKGDLTQEVAALKAGDGPDIVIFGSGSVVAQLARERLIDEYLLAVTPVVLSDAGRPMFDGVGEQKLELAEARSYDSGNALLLYRLATS